ncbi:EAL domain-containing protein [uncultured Aquitalea sp.]|uniref:EAL domain-containing response regulator n=1 Tax=uncultured Aquitalea sp. TaxID=540272 RepID=UPI0025F92049|nr:EAL domain-containing protein [uncultured Aquitalea sp.]
MPPTPSRQILLAEDSSSQRAYLKELCLSLPDVVVHEAADGSWALQLSRKLPQLDLVITDLSMPGMDGIELVERLSRQARLPSLLLISGHAPELLSNCMRAAKELGFTGIGYLAKPFSDDAFLAELGRLLATISPAEQVEYGMPLIDIITGLAHNQFCAFYQPIYDLGTGKAVQIEALARWRHPNKGILTPGHFISMLEHEGFIQLLTNRIVQTGLDLLIRNPAARDLRLSINLSRSLLDDRECLDWLVNQVEARGLEFNRVVLEITETMAFADFGHTLATLLRLRMRGFELSLDDFGTGHTTLEHVKNLPLTELKFDRVLIKDIHQDTRSQSIIAGMARIARELNLRMVAEGIDDENDLDYLCQHHPDIELQGFLLCKPVPAEELHKHLYPCCQQRSA